MLGCGILHGTARDVWGSFADSVDSVETGTYNDATNVTEAYLPPRSDTPTMMSSTVRVLATILLHDC